jgi:tRNA-dihydrouridine synthase B
VRALPGGEDFRDRMNRLESCDDQVRAVTDWFDALADQHPLLPRATAAANDPLIEPIDTDPMISPAEQQA